MRKIDRLRSTDNERIRIKMKYTNEGRIYITDRRQSVASHLVTKRTTLTRRYQLIEEEQTRKNEREIYKRGRTNEEDRSWYGTKRRRRISFQLLSSMAVDIIKLAKYSSVEKRTIAKNGKIQLYCQPSYINVLNIQHLCNIAHLLVRNFQGLKIIPCYIHDETKRICVLEMNLLQLKR